MFNLTGLLQLSLDHMSSVSFACVGVCVCVCVEGVRVSVCSSVDDSCLLDAWILMRLLGKAPCLYMQVPPLTSAFPFCLGRVCVLLLSLRSCSISVPVPPVPVSMKYVRLVTLYFFFCDGLSSSIVHPLTSHLFMWLLGKSVLSRKKNGK